MGAFLSPLRERARSRKVGWTVTACGSRGDAFRDYKIGLKSHSDAFNILLVDSEDAVPPSLSPWEHLRRRRGDEWVKPMNVSDAHCQLMVQTMEAWFLADPEALAGYYGDGFRSHHLPSSATIERIDRGQLEVLLNKAAHDTSKGEYKKIRDGAALLQRIRPAKVREALPHCDRLFSTIEGLIQ